jgi:hypothetical protein
MGLGLVVVASRAGVRRAASSVFVEEVPEDRLREGLAHAHDLEVEADLPSDGGSVGFSLRTTASVIQPI